MQTLQTVRRGALIVLVCLILFSTTASAWSTSDMDAKMDTMQAEMDATFAAKFGSDWTDDDSTEPTHPSSDDSDWDYDGTTDASSDLDQEMDDMQQDMDTTFSFFGSGDTDGSSDSDSTDSETGDQQNNENTNDGSTGWNTGNSGSSTDGTTDDSTTDTPPDSTDGSSSQPTSLEEATEQRLHELINNERQERGLQPFNWDSTLAQTADYKSNDMADRSYFDHTAPDGNSFRDIYNRLDYNCRIPYGGTVYLGGENIARTWYDRDVRTDTGSIVHYDSAAELADGLRRQWMTSDGHRKAILRPYYDNHGLGVEITDSGRVYATEHFC